MSTAQEPKPQPWIIISEKLFETLKHTRLTIAADLIQLKTSSMSDAVVLTKISCKSYPEDSSGMSVGVTADDTGCMLTVRKPATLTSPMIMEP